MVPLTKVVYCQWLAHLFSSTILQTFFDKQKNNIRQFPIFTKIATKFFNVGHEV